MQFITSLPPWVIFNSLRLVPAVKFLYKRRNYFLAYSIMKKLYATGWLARRLGYRTLRHGGNKARKTKGMMVATKKYVQKAISRSNEEKFTYSTLTTAFSNLNTTAQAPLLLNPLTRGNTDNNRIGDRVHSKYLEMTINVNQQLTIGNNMANFRFLILRYKNPRGVAPLTNCSDVFAAANPDPTEMFNHINVDFNSRYAIEWDSGIYTARPQFSGQLTQHAIHFKINIDHVTDYSLGNGGAIADIDKNAYYLYAITNNGTVNAFNITVTYRWTFQDM